MRTPFRTHDVPASAGSNEPVDASGNHHRENGNTPYDPSPGEEAVQNGVAVSPRRPSKQGIKKLLSKLPHIGLESYHRTVTLSVEKDIARVVVFKGRKITAWGSTRLEAVVQPGEDPENLVPGTQPSSPLSNLLDQLGIRYGGRWRESLDQLNQSQGGNYILQRWQRHGRCKHQCVGSGL